MMSAEKPMKPEEIINLLSKLKDETPDYPAEMLAGRKAAFLKQVVNIKIDGKGQGGEGGQQGGSPSAASSGGAASPGMLLQALVGFSVVAAMLTAAFALREKIVEALQENEVLVRDESSPQPQIGSTPLAPEATPAVPSLAAPAVADPQSEINESDPPVDLGDTNIDGASVAKGTPDPDSALDKTKTNNGLHLGQTPGTPAAPGQGNPGNPNQPEKPAKPEKTEKPPKPEKTKKTK
jgi:hypothetical protein